MDLQKAMQKVREAAAAINDGNVNLEKSGERKVVLDKASGEDYATITWSDTIMKITIERL